MNRTVVAAVIVAATLAVLAADARPGDDEASPVEVNVEVNEGWLALDVANAKKTLALLPPTKTTVASFLEKLDASDVREDRDTGFGGRRLFVADYGGYTTTWIKIAAFDGNLVALDVTIRGGPSEWPAIGERLTEAWGEPFGAIEHGRRYRWSDAAGLARHAAALEKSLGEAPESDVPESLADAVALLSSPLERLDVGDACYYAGSAPEGKQATDRIVASGRHDLLRRVLRGPNPDGRVYAARALLRRAAEGRPLPPADERTIAAIRASDVPISACSGCSVYETTAAELLH